VNSQDTGGWISPGLSSLAPTWIGHLILVDPRERREMMVLGLARTKDVHDVDAPSEKRIR
jgi:hypothetical protein